MDTESVKERWNPNEDNNTRGLFTQWESDGEEDGSIPPDHTDDWNDNIDRDSSSLSSSSSEEEEEEDLTYLEKRARKVQRNQALLESLGLARPLLHNKRKKPNQQATDDKENKDFVDENDAENSGVLPMALLSDDSVIVDDRTLYERFPHRQQQIRKLLSLLRPFSRTVHLIPAPIWVTGPSGTGKSDIVRSVVQHLSLSAPQSTTRSSSKRMLCAHVNCATLIGTTVSSLLEEVTTMVYRQFESLVYLTKSKGHKKRRSRPSTKPDKRRKTMDRDHLARSAAPTIDAQSKESTSKSLDKALSDYQNSSAMTVAKFGRDLQGLFRKRYCGIVVLDQAERLLSHTAVNSNNIASALAQLLLLPKRTNVPLAIVNITNSNLLHYTRKFRAIEGDG